MEQVAKPRSKVRAPFKVRAPSKRRPSSNQGLKQRAEMLGREAEQAVAGIWRRRGFDILAERLRTRAGEIDLVAADAQTLVFIEVKARRSLYDAAYAVAPRQQIRLLGAAGVALAEHLDWHRPETRFDVALVAGGKIALIEDAIRIG